MQIFKEALFSFQALSENINGCIRVGKFSNLNSLEQMHILRSISRQYANKISCMDF